MLLYGLWSDVRGWLEMLDALVGGFDGCIGWLRVLWFEHCEDFIYAVPCFSEVQSKSSLVFGRVCAVA